MAPVQEVQKLERKAKAAKTVLVSYDPSHSWLKSCDGMGVQTVQAGYVRNPTGRFKKDSENPLVIEGSSRRWYGEQACTRKDHVSLLYERKESAARDGLKALFRSEYDGKDLIVICTHHQESTAQEIAKSLTGQYDVTRNGDRIRCRVAQAIPEAESLGTWHLLRNQLIDGDTLLFDLGNGTTQEWVIDRTGEIIDGNATDSFPVSGLVESIAKDPLIRGKLCPLAKQSPNTDLIVRALRSGSISDILLERWEAVKQQHVDTWWTQVKSYLLKAHGTTLQSVANVIFTGGGSELIRDRLPGQFLSPDQPQTASLRGMYAHYHAQIANGVMKVGS